jgi:hypothetical protein
MNAVLQKQFQFWLGACDPIRLQAFRMCIGISLLLYMGFRWQYAGEWLTEVGFHISPSNLPYFDWAVPLLPEKMVSWFGLVFFTGISAFIGGWQLRIVSWLVLAGLVYVSAADQLAFFSSNKILIISVCVLAVSTVGGFARRRGDRQSAPSVWPIRILQATAMIHLFMAGWAKIAFGGEWLVKPYVFWTQVQGTYRTDAASFLLQHLPLRGWYVLQWSALIFELLFPLLLIVKPWRRSGIAGGIIFQLSIAVLMKHLIYFNLIMISFFVLFIDEDRLRQAKLSLSRVRAHDEKN